MFAGLDCKWRWKSRLVYRLGDVLPVPIADDHGDEVTPDERAPFRLWSFRFVRRTPLL